MCWEEHYTVLCREQQSFFVDNLTVQRIFVVLYKTATEDDVTSLYCISCDRSFGGTCTYKIIHNSCGCLYNNNM